MTIWCDEAMAYEFCTQGQSASVMSQEAILYPLLLRHKLHNLTSLTAFMMMPYSCGSH